MPIGYSTVTTRYEVVRSQPVSKSGKCVDCGKRVRRQFTAEATINPFNKVKEGPRAGQAKTHGEVFADVQRQAAEWKDNLVLRCTPHERAERDRVWQEARKQPAAQELLSDGGPLVVVGSIAVFGGAAGSQAARTGKEST